MKTKLSDLEKKIWNGDEIDYEVLDKISVLKKDQKAEENRIVDSFNENRNKMVDEMDDDYEPLYHGNYPEDMDWSLIQ